METKLIVLNNWTNNQIKLSELDKIENKVFFDNREIKNYDKKSFEVINNLRIAGECHRQVRKFIQSEIKPGMKLYDICNSVENKIIELSGANNLKCGIGFPCGLSINNIAAHDSGNPNDKRILKYDDICKIDFGVHRNQYIIDCAFSVAFDPKYEQLLNAAKDGMWTGIKKARPDILINEISKDIKEVIESYEIELNGNIYPIKSSKNLGGHTIDKNMIHAGKIVLGCPNPCSDRIRMEENEIWAIEVFPSTGSGFMKTNDNMETNHFMLKQSYNKSKFNFKQTNQVYNSILSKRQNLPFCNRWLYNEFGDKYKIGLNELVKKNIVEPFPPLIDTIGSYNAQFEHTIYIHDYGTEVLSAGDDY